MTLCTACGATFSAQLSHCPYCHYPVPKDPVFRVEVIHPDSGGPNACPICQRADRTRSVSAIVSQHTVHIQGHKQTQERRNDRHAHAYTNAQGQRVVEASQHSWQTSATTDISQKEQSALAKLLQCPDFAPPSTMGKIGIVFFGVDRWRTMRVEVRRWLANLQPFLGGVVGALCGVLFTVALIYLLRLDSISDSSINGTLLGYVVAMALWGSALLHGFAGYSLLRYLAPKWQRTFEKRMDEERLAKPAIKKWAELYYCEHDDIIFLPGQKYFAEPAQLRDFCLDAAERECNRMVDSRATDRGIKRS